MTTRRGFTMVELMIGLVLTLAVGGVTYQMLLNNQRVTRTQTEYVGMQDNVRSGALIIANELRDLGYDDVTAGVNGSSLALGGYLDLGTRSDLIAIGAGTIMYHATRGNGFVCSRTTAAPYKVVVYQATWQALRTPAATDSLMVYVENNAGTSADDAWIHLGITGAPVNKDCPTVAGVTPKGWEFTVSGPTLPNPLNMVTAMTNVVVGGPVRLTEVMRMSNYIANGKTWLGMRSESVANDQFQPVVGPLADSTGTVRGLRFRFWNANNVETADPDLVRAVTIDLRGVTDQPVRSSDPHQSTIDTLGLTTRVALRNMLR
jgi:prepilin-type N-terminal cleavage/methylation domain-containing protein